MDQAANQPARATSAPPTHATSVAHTNQPPDFWAKTMDPAQFWTAASAIATLLAVAAAFVIPWLTDRRQQKRRQAYASHFLLPVFDEAVWVATEARKCFRSSTSMAEGLRDQKKGSRGLDYHKMHGVVVGDAAANDLRFLAHAELHAYTSNRTWINDLELHAAGRIHSNLHESLRLLRGLRELVEEWTGTWNINADDLDRYSEIAGA